MNTTKNLVVKAAALCCAAANAGYSPREGGVIINTPEASVRLTVINDKIIRVSETTGAVAFYDKTGKRSVGAVCGVDRQLRHPLGQLLPMPLGQPRRLQPARRGLQALRQGGTRGGSYPGMKEKRDFNIVLVEPDRPVADAWLTKGTTVGHDGREIKIRL